MKHACNPEKILEVTKLGHLLPETHHLEPLCFLEVIAEVGYIFCGEVMIDSVSNQEANLPFTGFQNKYRGKKPFSHISTETHSFISLIKM